MVLDSEIVEGFRNETLQLLKETTEILGQLEEATELAQTDKCLGEFAIRIDRIMGASKTIAMMDPEHAGLKKIGAVAELCKSIGYKTIEKQNLALVPVVTSFFSDALECIEGLLKSLQDSKATAAELDAFTNVLKSRMEVVAKYLK